MWLAFNNLENVYGNYMTGKSNAEINLRKIYLDFAINLQHKIPNAYDAEEDFVKQLKIYARKRMERQYSNNYWKLRRG